MTTKPSNFTAAEKLEAIQREIKYRRRVYPRWVSDGRMTPQLAEKQIAVFEAIERDYEERAKAEAPPTLL